MNGDSSQALTQAPVEWNERLHASYHSWETEIPSPSREVSFPLWRCGWFLLFTSWIWIWFFPAHVQHQLFISIRRSFATFEKIKMINQFPHYTCRIVICTKNSLTETSSHTKYSHMSLSERTIYASEGCQKHTEHNEIYKKNKERNFIYINIYMEY